jgi:putative oxidoreductase
MRGTSGNMKHWGLLVLRLAVGAVFIYHGWMKLSGMEATASMMTGIGLPMPMFWAWLVAIVEFGGGIAIILGLFNRIVTALLAINMVVALLTVHTKMPYGGATELPIVLLAALLALHTTGPGNCALMGRKQGSGCACGEGKDGCCGGDCGDHHEEKKDVKTV